MFPWAQCRRLRMAATARGASAFGGGGPATQRTLWSLWRTGAFLRRSFASEGSRPVATGAGGYRLWCRGTQTAGLNAMRRCASVVLILLGLVLPAWSAEAPGAKPEIN